MDKQNTTPIPNRNLSDTAIAGYDWLKPTLSNRWILYFLKIARTIAEQSKDPSTKVGAVIVSPDKQIISTGYNGFPVGVDDALERYEDRPTKLKMVVHAEANAICQAAKHGHHIDGCAIFCTLVPCIGCAKLIIQSGIKTVYFPAYPTQAREDYIPTVTVSIMDGAIRALEESIIKFINNSGNAYLHKCVDKQWFKVEEPIPDTHYISFHMPLDMLYILATSPLGETCCEVARYVSNQVRGLDEEYKKRCCALKPEITVEPLISDVGLGVIVKNPDAQISSELEWRDKITDSINLLQEANVHCYIVEEDGNPIELGPDVPLDGLW